MMLRFHIIDDAAAVLVSRGVYKQAKLYRRGNELFAGHGGGFIRIGRHGTSVPGVSCVGVDVHPFKLNYDTLGRAEVTE